MSIDRRKFLKAAGLSAVAGIAGGRSVKALADEILPEELPLVGNRWAMVIDLKKCQKEKGCTKCIDACHFTHNVPEISDKEEEIKWIWKDGFEHAFHEQGNDYISEKVKHGPTLLLCNHCDNPPCTRVCPTQSTWKREDGIVMMDMHRCIGCRYCIAACPYGSRSFNWRDPKLFLKELNPTFPTRSKGVVEKCNFCAERIARGIPLACVDACPVDALVFGDADDPKSSVRKLLKDRFTIRRKPGLGTNPQIYYIV
ncbi:MAG: 4Fe-4S dicluster domain-containing protein [candidate division Zixibacteria bacterium]|nr:4Fe-4S dicluster domain-containing protein [candidate division Zixibacteria bacterium]